MNIYIDEQHGNGDVMNEKFRDIINLIPKLFEKLVNSQPKYRENLGNLPKSGIYVFYEDGIPIYVGRTNRMKDRILEHSRPSSTHNSAPFAFNLAKKTAMEMGIDISNKKRVELEKEPVFINLFTQSKNRVSKMLYSAPA